MLIVMAGLPGTGKSAVAQKLRDRLGYPMISVDTIEEAILSAGIDDDQPTGLAAYLVAEALASGVLESERSVIIDAVNAGEKLAKVDHSFAEFRVLCRTKLRNILDMKEPVAVAETLHVFERIAAGHREVPGVELQPDHAGVGSLRENIVRGLAATHGKIGCVVVKADPDLALARYTPGLIQPIGPPLVVGDCWRSGDRQARNDDVFVPKRLCGTWRSAQ